MRVYYNLFSILLIYANKMLTIRCCYVFIAVTRSDFIETAVILPFETRNVI
jgi:hypothetical protein